MLRQVRVCKFAVLTVLGISTLAAGCVPDNLWSDIWGYTIIDGTAAVLRDALLGLLGL